MGLISRVASRVLRVVRALFTLIALCIVSAAYAALVTLSVVVAFPLGRLLFAAVRFIVPDFMGRGESTPSAHFYQNLGEAEYVFNVLHVFAFTFACSRTHK